MIKEVKLDSDGNPLPPADNTAGATPPATKSESVDVAMLEKRFKDTQAELTRKSQALADAEKALTESRIARLESGKSAEPPVDVAAQRAAMVKALQEGGEGAIIDLMDNYARQLHDSISGGSKEAITKAEARMSELQAEIERLRLQSDPVYQAHKDKVEELKAEGLTEQQAFKVLKRLNPSIVIPKAETPPAGTSGGRGGSDERKSAPSDAEVREFVKMMGGSATAKQIENFKKRGLKR